MKRLVLSLVSAMILSSHAFAANPLCEEIVTDAVNADLESKRDEISCTFSHVLSPTDGEHVFTVSVLCAQLTFPSGLPNPTYELIETKYLIKTQEEAGTCFIKSFNVQR